MANEEKERGLADLKALLTTKTVNKTVCSNRCQPLERSEASKLIKVEMKYNPYPWSLQKCINEFTYSRKIEGFPCDECN